MNRYYQYKTTCMARSSKFYVTPQAFGNWNDPEALPDTWYYFLLPPYYLQKCLKYLPLCYGVDGTFDFGRPALVGHSIESLTTGMGSMMIANDNYAAVQTANEKITVYGKILKDTDWKGAECLSPHPQDPRVDFPLGTEHFTILDPIPDPNDHISPYVGYIQSGYYHNGTENYYMLVNRRTERFTGIDPAIIPLADYPSYYIKMPEQIVEFKKCENGSLASQYGSNPGLYDPFTHDLQLFENGVAHVTIDAGEASLRQIVASLPNTINTNYTATRDIFVKGFIGINNGAVVDLSQHKLTLLDNSNISVSSGATLIISGDLDAKLMSRIHVEDHGTLTITQAHCTMGMGSKIILDEAIDLNIIQSDFDSEAGSTWDGIYSRGGQIIFSESTIKNATTSFLLENSSLQMTSSKIYIPANGEGIEITEIGASQMINLLAVNNVTNLITCLSATPNGARGVVMKSRSNPLFCSGTVFQNLEVGIEYSLSAAKADSIADCEFKNCLKGINVSGSSGLAKIKNCQFNYQDPSTSVTYYGIKLQTYNPLITNCNFLTNSSNNCITGILLDTSQSVKEKTINNCTFENLCFGIQSRESQIKITNNIFTHTKNGVAVGSKSLICMNNQARNVFNAFYSNILFWDYRLPSDDTEKFTANVLLRNGHNDFYHNGICRDLRFDDHQYDFANSSRIDASGNFWASVYGVSNSPLVIPAEHSSLINCDYSDSAPNTPFPNPINNRLDLAIEYEAIEAYTSAYTIYQQILHERLPEEKDYLDICIPKIFSLAKGNQLDLDALLSYYDAEIALTNPAEKIEMIWLMNTYKAFTCLEKKDYQGAANIISERITNPISEIDSLNAVMDLEIVYLQRELDGAKKPLTTNYTQYKYPDLQTFNIKHEENILKLQAIYDRKNEIQTTVPAMLHLSRNYPNPFNPTTTIEFGVPKATKVSLKIYNIRGQLVKELVNAKHEPGKFKAVWDGKNDIGKSAATGVYFYRLDAAGKTITHKMLLLK